MDKFDREHFAQAYRALAEIFARQRTPDEVEDHIPFLLGDMARRIFVGSQYDPPDEILEATASVMRSGDDRQRKALADRLLRHADHLDEISAAEDG